MIREQWYVVLDSRELGLVPLGVIRLGERLVFWRDRSGRALCHVDRCAHRGASLAIGKLVDGDRLQCPFHGLEYDASGRCTKVPANGAAESVPEGFKLCTYPVHETRGFIWIFWGLGEAPAAPRFFDDIPEKLLSATGQDPWRIHYSRVVENQLDLAHLPFVHHNTIGKGNRTVVDGPGILHVENGFFVYLYNRLDDGRPRRSSAEVPVPNPDSSFKLEFLFPNLWQNYISPGFRIVAAFVPVDEGRTLLYLRVYHGFTRIPLLRQLVEFLLMRTNYIIAHQDRRVVETQVPPGDGSATGEILFPGDAPIMEYRKMRMAARKALG